MSLKWSFVCKIDSMKIMLARKKKLRALQRSLLTVAFGSQKYHHQTDIMKSNWSQISPSNNISVGAGWHCGWLQNTRNKIKLLYYLKLIPLVLVLWTVFVFIATAVGIGFYLQTRMWKSFFSTDQPQEFKSLDTMLLS